MVAPILPPSDRCRVILLASGREWRGGQRQVMLLARGLADAGGPVESVVVTGDDSVLADRCRAVGVTVHGVTWRVGIDPRVMPGLLSLIGPGTIIHAHDQHAHTLADAAVRIRGGRVVVTRRVDFAIRHPGRWRRVAHAIALSQPVRDRIIAAGVAPTRISVIPAGVVLGGLDPGPPWAEVVAQRRPDHRLIVAIAALSAEKGLDVLLDAAALIAPAHPDLTWVVLGEGRERAALEARRDSLGLGAVVSFPGHVEHPEAALAQAELLVQPSRSEGFGSSVLDALALGVPIVASDAGGLPESLAAGGGVLVPAGDAPALARAVAALLDDSGQRERLSGDGRLAAQEFALPRLVQRTLEVYRAVADPPPH
jgi:glycosyltransferase involved in cell wall biosynthesis